MTTTFSGPELRRLLAAVFVGAVVFRVALFYSGFVEVVYDTYDSWEYRDLAWSMLQHGTFGLEGVPKMNRTPGYPGFLAVLFSLFGGSRVAVTGAQVALDAVTCVMVVHIAVAMRLRRAAIAGVALLAVSCLFTAIYSMMMMTEVVYTFLITAALWALATSPRPPAETFFHATLGRVVLSAAAIGCAILVRPALVPPAMLFGAFVVGAGILRPPLRSDFWRAIRQPLAFAMVVALIVMPWLLRNYVVFHDEFTRGGNDQLTLFGYKTDILTYRHWYTKEFSGYLYSNEEPFVMTKGYRPPELARHVYPEEKADLERAFAALEPQLLLGDQPLEPASLQEFARITDNRYRAAARLHVTAPLSRALRIWVSPRISAFWKDTSGLNSSRTLVASFTAYDLLYVVPGFVGLLWGFHRVTPVGFWFVLAMILGHTWMYSVWLPMPQSRYAIPLFPFIALAAGMFLHQVSVRRAAADDIVPGAQGVPAGGGRQL